MKTFFSLTTWALIALLVTTSCLEQQRKEIKRLENYISDLKEETVPLKFKILQRDTQSVTFAVKMFDAEGTEFAKKEYTMQGKELSFDFCMVRSNGRFVAFPCRVFTDRIAPKDGELLFDLYDSAGFPRIFHHAGLKADTKIALSEIFAKIKIDSLQSLSEQFGSGVHDIQEIKSFNAGYVYRIVSRTKGGLEILKD